jgi:Tol biopolymer transport system component/predicted Ser/Thr protein kinase
MTVDKGVRLGPYEIVSRIGAGGMGEVYLATDTRLNRRVAIKILPPQWSADLDMKSRFEREAKIIAGFTHPNICTLYDVGRQDDVEFLVMEYLEGQTLSDRIQRGVLNPEEALPIAIQIAHALDTAHREGITHRDLKPGNIMLTKTGAKLLDFGLAKQQAPLQSRSVTTSAMPTREEATMQGAIVGTMQYMAPEQLEGKDATPQTDIFAFGAVLYEMLTGQKAFISDSPARLISAILTAAPVSISATLPVPSPALDYAVKKCLEKDPANRWQSARDLADQLKWILEVPVSAGSPSVVKAAPRPSYAKLLAPLTAVLVIAVALLAYLNFRAAPPLTPIEFVIGNDVAGGSFAISPNGRFVAFAGRVPGSETRALFIREMSSVSPRQIAGTDGALAPFWSPDNQHVGFFDNSSLKTVSIASGNPEKICEAPGSNRNGAWNKDNVIVFSSNDVLQRVSASGGTPEQMTTLNLSRAEILHTAPFFLPDGKHFVFSVLSQQIADRAIYTGSLDSKETTRLLPVRSQARYAAGYLLYIDGGALLAQPFDPASLKPSSMPIRVAAGVSNFSVSENGVLAYRAAPPTATTLAQYVWFDRNGKQSATVGDPGPYAPYWSLSPDGRQAATTRVEPGSGNVDIWILDLERGVTSRLTSDPSPDADGRWSPDSLSIAYTTQEKGNRDIMEKKVSGLEPEIPLLNSPAPESLDDWSPDGRYILYRTGAQTNTIYALPLFGDRKPFPVIETQSNKDGVHISFDSNWLAFNALESGRSQVYVVSFPKPDQKRQISLNGGVQPHWRKDGKELYYLSWDGKMMAVDIIVAPSLSSGTPRVLFDTGLKSVSFDGDDYAVTADGQRFLLLKPLPAQTSTQPPPPVTVLLNWTTTLKTATTH